MTVLLAVRADQAAGGFYGGCFGFVPTELSGALRKLCNLDPTAGSWAELISSGSKLRAMLRALTLPGLQVCSVAGPDHSAQCCMLP